MSQHATQGFQFKDDSVRLVEEKDIPAVSNLFKLNYGDAYLDLAVYDGRWVKKCIYNEGIICVVIEEDGEILATGALMLDYGDYNDQIGELSRLVVHPEATGRNLGSRIINALFDLAGENVEFAFGRTRTANTFSQITTQRAGFNAVGFLPCGAFVNNGYEHLIPVVKLHGNAVSLRSDEVPQVIPEIAPIARYVLASMELQKSLSVVEDCPPYEDAAICSIQPLDRVSLARLARIEHGRLVEPLLFGGVSLDQGLSYIRRRNAVYLMAVDDDQNPVGALGYQNDDTSKIVKGIELVAREKNLRGHLCGSLLKEAEKLGAKVIEVNISAYDARLQSTFYNHGFRPVAYMPAMVFHGTSRLDVVKMLKLNMPYERGDMKLTEQAETIVSIIEKEFA